MKSLKHLNKYLFKYKWHLIGGTVFIIISNFFTIVPAQAIRSALDLVEENIKLYRHYDGLLTQKDLYNLFTKALLLFAVVVLVMALLKGIFLFFTRQTIIIMSRLVEFDLKNEIYAHYQKLDLAFYRQNNTGDLMARISEDVSRVRMYIGPAIMYSLNMVVLVILIIIAMLRVNVMFTVYVLLPLPLLSITIYFISDIINKKSEYTQQQLSGLSTHVQEAFSGVRVLKAYMKEDSSSRHFSNQSLLYRNASLDLVKTNAFFSPFILLLIGMSTLITVYVGGKQAIEGNVTIGNIAEFIIYVNLLTWPVASIGWVISLVQRAAASQERINEFLRIQPDIFSPTDSIQEPLEGKIEFRNVSFSYPDSNIHALKNINFTINKGESLAILGRTGSGKSTIASLLLRLYDTSEGDILIDGHVISRLDLYHYREAIGYVPQDVFLFSDTIKNNISFGEKNTESITDERVAQAALYADVYDNIIEFPDKFETMIGERGITLSGGQKQRVSIARAIMKNPQILLFDDCLSAVDTQTEEKIIRNLRQVMKGKTTVIISHRVSAVKHCDHIVYLEAGEIKEHGTHNELMDQKGLYYKLYQKQQLEKQNSDI